MEKLFSNKIKAGCFSDELMNSVFSSNPGVSVASSPGPPPGLGDEAGVSDPVNALH